MSSSALERLKAKHRQKLATPTELAAKKAKELSPTAHSEVTAQAGTTKAVMGSILKRTMAPKVEPSTSGTTSVSPEKTALGALQGLTKAKADAATSTVKAQLEQREADGLYNLPPEAYEIAGEAADRLLDKMRELDEATLSKTPSIAHLSIATRKNLEQYPELVHILSEEQLGIIVQGFLVAADIELAPKTPQGKAAASKTLIAELASANISDLF